MSSDTAAIEPVPAPSSRPRNHLPSIRDLFDSDSEELQSSAHQKHLDSPKIESKYRSKHRVEADVPRSSPHTPENKVKSHAHKAKDDVESPLFVSPLAALEIINTYPRHNQKKVRKGQYMIIADLTCSRMSRMPLELQKPPPLS